MKFKSPNDKILVGVAGFHNRGMHHLEGYLAIPNVEVAYVCDVDSRQLDRALAATARKQKRKPKAVKDLRKVLDDPEVDAVSLGLPDHWHATGTVMACAAGKHVFVEKPDGHDAREGELMVAAARKYDRLVQIATQRRSWPWVQETMAALRGGELGNISFARAWYTLNRPSIGHAEPTPVPDWLDYDLWQGPAPEQPYLPHIFEGEKTIHYNWHWFWNYGTAELGNNGVHSLDLARWGMGVETAPRRVTCSGKRYHFKDDAQTPDVTVATFDFGDKCMIWDGQSCDPHGFEDAQFGVSFFGENGSLVIAGTNVRVYDLKNKLVRELAGQGDDVVHYDNFIKAIRGQAKLNAEIAVGQKSSLLAHLGNISWRTGRTIHFDPEAGKIIDDKEAAALWGRTYRPGWELKV